jgi:hypothetical protein
MPQLGEFAKLEKRPRKKKFGVVSAERLLGYRAMA